MTRIAVCGAAGRMGKTILEVCHDTEDVSVTAAIEHKDSPVLGLDAGELVGIGKQGVSIIADITAVMEQFDVLIDFTMAAVTVRNVELCRAAGKRMIIGTTGLNDEQIVEINAASEQIAIMLAPNMSIGVNLCFKLVELASQIVGETTDIEIIDMHHNQKKDAPSGTAIRLGEIIAKVLGRDLKECAVYGREGITGARDITSIGFNTIRAGDIVGEHTVIFAAAGERVEITHKATNRKTFASGAVKAAKWIMSKESGLFDMQDVLGLR